ncbi:MAG: 50S ribosomal protein L3 N(5)-glutamine methyltransferase [Gammaproteobacteria bacterium]
MNDSMTIRDLIAWGAGQFEAHGLAYGHGTDNALDESAALVLHALAIDYDQPDSILDTQPDRQGLERARALLQARVTTRKPAAYLVNQAWFAGMPFYVDERVLVPRSPVAELIGARFMPWIEPDRVQAILDLCTGSGCIGIACARAFPDAQVTATDISAAALAVAAENVRRHTMGSRVRLLEADLFTGLAHERYDIIVSNPPYVPLDEYAGLAAEFRHEPAIGLAAGTDGLDSVAAILREAADFLNPGGILVVEVGYTMERLIDRYPSIPFVWLDFEHGGDGVFLLDQEQLVAHRAQFEAVAAGRGAAGI